MNHLIETLERDLLDPFQTLADRLRRENQNFVVNVTSNEGGQRTNNPCHAIAIECLFMDAPANETDHLALVVLVDRLNAHPRLTADVGWGHPSGWVEAEFTAEPVEVSTETLNELYSALPRLYESLEAAIARRKPLVSIAGNA